MWKRYLGVIYLVPVYVLSTRHFSPDLKIWSETREQNTSPTGSNLLARRFTAHFPDHRKTQVEGLTLDVFFSLQAKVVRRAQRPHVTCIEGFIDHHAVCLADVIHVVLYEIELKARGQAAGSQWKRVRFETRAC